MNAKFSGYCFNTTIKHSRKSLFFDKTSTWVQENISLFDTMRSREGAEICELVGLYLLNLLGVVIDKSSVGLYRDDGLAAIANSPKFDRIRKYIIVLFKEEGLSITLERNLIEIGFLDVTFNTFPFERLTTHLSTSMPLLNTQVLSLKKYVSALLSCTHFSMKTLRFH